MRCQNGNFHIMARKKRERSQELASKKSIARDPKIRQRSGCVVRVFTTEKLRRKCFTLDCLFCFHATSDIDGFESD